MKRRRPLMLVVPVSALVAVGTWLLWSERAPAAPVETIESTAKINEQLTRQPSHGVDQNQLRRVQAEVDAKNRNAAKDRDAFQKDGWQLVSVAEPDHRVVGYDPSLIDAGREHDLKMQLLSTVPSPGQARKVAEIARRAKEPATRYAAVEALGHLQAPEATAALYDLLTNGNLDPSDEARGQIPSLLRPSALDDPMAAQVAMLLDSPLLSDVEKQQIAFTLALIGLRDGMKLDPQVPVSSGARALIDQMAALAQARFVKALDRQGGNP